MAEDQTTKFEPFDGDCERLVAPPGSGRGHPVPCDLFRLSWTLTPRLPKSLESGAVWDVAHEADARLAHAVNAITMPPPAPPAPPPPAPQSPTYPNAHGQILNLLYVDYVQYARVADVATYLNATAAQSSLQPWTG